MNVMSILCQRCGAPLQIADESVRFVTCAHCGTPLEIVREATQAHSRIMEEIHAATAESAKTLKVIELQNDLERLDREWSEREVIIDGALVGWEKDYNNSALFALAVGLGCVVLLAYAAFERSFVSLIFGLLSGSLVYLVLRGFKKAAADIRRLETEVEEHDARRQLLVRAIEEAKKAS